MQHTRLLLAMIFVCANAMHAHAQDALQIELSDSACSFRGEQFAETVSRLEGENASHPDRWYYLVHIDPDAFWVLRLDQVPLELVRGEFRDCEDVLYTTSALIALDRATTDSPPSETAFVEQTFETADASGSDVSESTEPSEAEPPESPVANDARQYGLLRRAPGFSGSAGAVFSTNTLPDSAVGYFVTLSPGLEMLEPRLSLGSFPLEQERVAQTSTEATPWSLSASFTFDLDVCIQFAEMLPGFRVCAGVGGTSYAIRARGGESSGQTIDGRASLGYELSFAQWTSYVFALRLEVGGRVRFLRPRIVETAEIYTTEPVTFDVRLSLPVSTW